MYRLRNHALLIFILGLLSPLATTSSPSRALASSVCWGDCSGDGSVTIDEITILTNIVLGAEATSLCSLGNAVEAGWTVVEIVQAIARSLHGCGDADLCEDLMQLATRDEIAQTPRVDENLELLALSLSPTRLTAEETLYQRVVRDIGNIRRDYPEIGHIDYRPIYSRTDLMVRFTDEAAEGRLVDGADSGWNCVTEHYELTSLTPQFFPLTWTASFEGNYRMQLLGELLQTLPGVVDASPLPVALGGGPTIKAEQDGATIRYVFDDASGDCPSGCTSHVFYTFTVDGEGVVTFVGREPESGGGGGLGSVGGISLPVRDSARSDDLH